MYDRYIDGWMIGRVGGPTDRTDTWMMDLTDGPADGWMDGKVDGRMHGSMYERTDRLLYY